jgi:hypothetical protein
LAPGLTLWLFQATTTVAGETSSAGGTTVHLAPEQMAQLANQAQGNTAFICGFIAFGIMALAGLFWRSTGA